MKTIPYVPPAEAQAARRRRCPLCGTRRGTACQAKPEGDHLARYLDAYTARHVSRAYLARVLADLVVLAQWQIVPGGAR